MDLGILGRNAFVCASTGGIGLAVADALAAEGVNVAVTGRRADVAAREAERIRQDYQVDAIGLGCDLLDADSRREVLAQAVAELGPIDIILLNGPGPRPGGSEELQPVDVVEAARSLIAPHVDLVGQVLPGMKERGWGRIIAIGSYTMEQASTTLSLSAIGRAGLQRYLGALAREVAATGVTVNIVEPGLISTARVAALDEAAAAQSGQTTAQIRAERERSIPYGRLGKPAELAAAVAFFASDEARYLTGQSLRVDGGLYA